MIRKILVALDESENSIKALTLSAEIASQTSSELYILTVIPPISTSQIRRRGVMGLGGGGGMGMGLGAVNAAERMKDLEIEIEEKHQKILLDSNELIKNQHPNVVVNPLIFKGPIAQTILDTANEKEVDIIVVGTGNKTGLKGLILGSVSKQVVGSSSKSVLIAK